MPKLLHRQLALLLLLSVSAYGQITHIYPALDTNNNFTGIDYFTQLVPPYGTYAQMQAWVSPPPQMVWFMTDATSVGVCTQGGGTYQAWCGYWNGHWVNLGGGDGGAILCSQMPALTGAVTTSAGSCSTAGVSTRECEIVWGGSGAAFALTSGDDAIANQSCLNDLGSTETITSVKCRSDAGSNTTTITPTFGSAGTGTSICSGALTCGSSGAYSSSCTVSNASLTAGSNINPVMGGTLTGTSIHVVVKFTVPVL